MNLEAVVKLDPRQRTSPSSRELLAQGVGNVGRRAWIGEDPRHVGHRPQLGEHQRREPVETIDGRPRHPAPAQRRLPGAVAEHDPALLPGGDPAGHRAQAGQPGPGQADVEGGALPVHPVRADGRLDRPDRPADWHPDRDGGEHQLHPPEQRQATAPEGRREAPGGRGNPHRACQSGELPQSGRPDSGPRRDPFRGPRPAQCPEHRVYRPGPAQPDPRLRRAGVPGPGRPGEP